MAKIREKSLEDIRLEWPTDKEEVSLADARLICEIDPSNSDWKDKTRQKVKQLATYLPDPLLFYNNNGPFAIDVDLSEAVKKFYHSVLIPYWEGESQEDSNPFVARANRLRMETLSIVMDQEVEALEGGFKKKYDAKMKKLQKLQGKK